MTSLPILTVPVTDPSAVAALAKLEEALEEHEDVKEVFTNAELPDDATGSN